MASLSFTPEGQEEVKKRKKLLYSELKENHSNWDNNRCNAWWCWEASKIVDNDPEKLWNKEDTLEKYDLYTEFAQGCSLETLNSFLSGQPIRERVFQAFCLVLGIDWQDIVSLDVVHSKNSDKSAILQKILQKSWVGRTDLIVELSTKLQKDCRFLLLTGMTGIGKTALGCQLIQNLQVSEWVDTIYLNFEDRGISDIAQVADMLLSQWGIAISDEMRQQPQDLWEMLVRKLQRNRYLIQFDSLETLLEGNEDTGWSHFIDSNWLTFFQSFLEIPNCQSRLILTSQDFPTQFQELGYTDYWQETAIKGLKPKERLALFSQIGIEVEASQEQKNYLERIGKAYEGHPLALLMVGVEILGQEFSGDVITYWKNYGHEIEKVEQAHRNTKPTSENPNFKIDRLNANLKIFVQIRIENSLFRLKQHFSDAYYLLLCGSVYNHPYPQDAWFYVLRKWLSYQPDMYQIQVALEVLFDRYLVEPIPDPSENGELLRIHNLIRSVARSLTYKEKQNSQSKA